MKPTANDIVDLIDREIRWHEEHKDLPFSAEYKKGFINGLIQAKTLIGDLKDKMLRDFVNNEVLRKEM